MSECYLVRHAQASYGSDDYDRLSALGRRQARWLGEYFAERGIAFDALLTGDLNRHRETADELCLGLGRDCPRVVDGGLNEYRFDTILASYLRRQRLEHPARDADRREYYRLLKAALLAWAAGALDADAGERWSEFRARVAAVLAALRERHPGQRVLAISSGGAIAMALGQILALRDDKIVELNLQVRNTGVSQLFFSARAIRLGSFNNVPHLDRAGRGDALTYS